MSSSLASCSPLDLRFAIIGDPHVGLPHTWSNHPQRFHLIEVSIPALEQILEQIIPLNLDFLLIPGDLTQHGERDNHRWLSDRLAQLPFPTYVVPGNHDVPYHQGDRERIGLDGFVAYYPHCGYGDNDRLYYSTLLAPGLRLIGLNSNWFDDTGRQWGWLDDEQITWLGEELQRHPTDLVFLMIHHNVLEHLPDQTNHPIGRRYMLGNAKTLLECLNPAQVPLIITGHLHVQDVVQRWGFCEVTTGSLVSYPHPYRLCQFSQTVQGERSLRVQSPRIHQLEDWPDLQTQSRRWMASHSEQFMLRFLGQPPLNLSLEAAQPFLKRLQYLWADIADGDQQLHFPQFPDFLRSYLEQFSAVDDRGHPTHHDNEAILRLTPGFSTSPSLS